MTNWFDPQAWMKPWEQPRRTDESPDDDSAPQADHTPDEPAAQDGPSSEPKQPTPGPDGTDAHDPGSVEQDDEHDEPGEPAQQDDTDLEVGTHPQPEDVPQAEDDPQPDDDSARGWKQLSGWSQVSSWDQGWSQSGRSQPRGLYAEFAKLAIGRTVTSRLAGREVTATIRDVELTPNRTGGLMGGSMKGSSRMRPSGTGERLDGVLEKAVVVLDNVQWGQSPLDQVRIEAAQIQLDPPPGSAIATGPMTIVVSAPLSTLAAWVNDTIEDVELTALEPATTAADHFRRVADTQPPGQPALRAQGRWRRVPFTALLVPRVTPSSTVLAIRDVRLFDRKIPLPRRWSAAADIPVAMVPDLRFLDVGIEDDGSLVVHLRHEGTRWPLNFGRLLQRLRRDDHPVGLGD